MSIALSAAAIGVGLAAVLDAIIASGRRAGLGDRVANSADAVAGAETFLLRSAVFARRAAGASTVNVRLVCVHHTIGAVRGDAASRAVADLAIVRSPRGSERQIGRAAHLGLASCLLAVIGGIGTFGGCVASARCFGGGVHWRSAIDAVLW